MSFVVSCPVLEHGKVLIVNEACSFVYNNNLYILSDAFTFFKNLKAEDRAHRHGQKRVVNVYIFCAKVAVITVLYNILADYFHEMFSLEFSSVALILIACQDTSDELQWQQLNRSLLRVSSTVNGKRHATREIEVYSFK